MISIDYFEKAIALDPAEPDNYAEIGAVYHELGRYDEATAKLKRACELHLKDIRARLNLGKVFLDQYQLKDAVREFREAVDIDKSSDEPRRGLAAALMRSGDEAEAEAILRAAISELGKENHWQLCCALSSLLTQRGDNSNQTRWYEEALQEANEAVRLSGGKADARFQRGVVRFKLKQYWRAREDFRACLDGKHKLDPSRKANAERYAEWATKQLAHEMVAGRGSLYGGLLMTFTCVALLAIMWRDFFWSHRIPEASAKTLLITLTPILLGLMVVACLLPLLSHIKLPGMEAELKQAKAEMEAPTISLGRGDLMSDLLRPSEVPSAAPTKRKASNGQSQADNSERSDDEKEPQELGETQEHA